MTLLSLYQVLYIYIFLSEKKSLFVLGFGEYAGYIF